MKKLPLWAAVTLVLMSLPACCAESISTTVYPFENRFSSNAKIAVDKVKTQFGDVADAEIHNILVDISFSPLSGGQRNTELVHACKKLGFGAIPALDRVMCNPDPELRKRAVWMAARIVYIKEDRKADYPIVEEALSWLFCRMVTDVDASVRNEASVGLRTIVSFRKPNLPIPQGALEGIWLYKLITPYSQEYSKRINQYNQYKIPGIESWFAKLWVDYELKKVSLDRNAK